MKKILMIITIFFFSYNIDAASMYQDCNQYADKATWSEMNNTMGFFEFLLYANDAGGRRSALEKEYYGLCMEINALGGEALMPVFI